MTATGSPGNPNPNPNLSKPMLVHHFLRALARVNRTAPKQSHARRSRRIRCAAYASMAAAAGPGRRWSRVLLRRLRSSPSSHRRRISVRVARPPRIATASSRVETLRRLVPGDGAWDTAACWRRRRITCGGSTRRCSSCRAWWISSLRK
uniref:IBH1-like N-terminal domain-containing protein n=1 Tax=Ananas comosus var. bracteatus TaxID=296719 RepID=A0A6V7Q8I0_ANACO|nr:unnamed protein product [Ananas comosus var. bracteatus]